MGASVQVFSELMCALQSGREQTGFPAVCDYKALSHREMDRLGIPGPWEAGALGPWGST